MSIEINWDALAGGPQGSALAESIRAFVHDRFQQVDLPRFIRSVKVHSFDFGTIAPELELKDVCDPLPDFYDDDEDDTSPDDRENEGYEAAATTNSTSNGSPARTGLNANALTARDIDSSRRLDTNFSHATFMRSLGTPNPFLSRSSTPGIPGGTSNMGYFHLPLSAGISGTATPLATAVGVQFGTGWSEHLHSPMRGSDNHGLTSDIRRTSFNSRQSVSGNGNGHSDFSDRSEAARDKSVEDVQIVMHLKYSGDIKLSLTAEILLDYPMPSFVGIPLRLTVTGLTFDGVALLAYIKSKAHFCFLAPEDADALVGRSTDVDVEGRHTADSRPQQDKRVGGLFEEIKVESEIGQKTNGKQVLKNVGKVEKFVLEQVRRIFESEFVYPSFWTFLV